jgi:hypothetical protein
MFIMIAVVFAEHLHPESDFPHNKVIILMTKTNHIFFFFFVKVC